MSRSFHKPLNSTKKWENDSIRICVRGRKRQKLDESQSKTEQEESLTFPTEAKAKEIQIDFETDLNILCEEGKNFGSFVFPEDGFGSSWRRCKETSLETDRTELVREIKWVSFPKQGFKTWKKRHSFENSLSPKETGCLPCQAMKTWKEEFSRSLCLF